MDSAVMIGTPRTRVSFPLSLYAPPPGIPSAPKKYQQGVDKRILS